MSLLQRIMESPKPNNLSVVRGINKPGLLRWTLGDLLSTQAAAHGEREAIVCSWSKARWTYKSLHERCILVAKALLALGVRQGDRIGILSGNDERYIEVFFGAAFVGGIVVVLNNTYTPSECVSALEHSGCSILFLSLGIGRKDMADHFSHITASKDDGKSRVPHLKNIVFIRETTTSSTPQSGLHSYEGFLSQSGATSEDSFLVRNTTVTCNAVCNLQYTSGTTGAPKAAMLTHYNIVNNGRFIGDRMNLTENDKICCPPPLFHCFGLVLGLLACITHGSTLVLPSQTFQADMTLSSVVEEKCTGLHGVPTMFLAVLEEYEKRDVKGQVSLRTGIAAGSPVPSLLMERLRGAFGLADLTIAYGMTETSPVSFMTCVDDALEHKLATVGRVLPHTTAKVVDRNGGIVPCGVPGELWVSGYNVHAGYLNDAVRTAESMFKDIDGTLWMRTGDEVTLDENGYCRITGRIKDVIIRGGENIYPREIEERLSAHPSISDAVVVGLKNEKYGEVPAAFLKPSSGENVLRPTTDEIQEWVRAVLGRHKVPIYMFWLGEEGIGPAFPITGSGKIRKNVLREIGDEIVASLGIKKRDERSDSVAQ